MSNAPVLPRSMTIDEFTPLVGEWLLADTQPEPVKIRLVEAKLLQPNVMAARPPFILTFYTPPQCQLLDGGYILRCGQFGPDIVYLSSLLAPPMAEQGFYYQAIFN